MKVQTKKVKVVLLKPHKVILEIIPTGKQIQLPRKVFEKRVEMGLLEVINPDIIPAFL
jgi:hypothetical protein